MNNDNEIKRLKRFIIISWSMLLILIVGLVFWASINIKELKSQVQLAVNKQPTIVHGINGSSGPQGLPGVSIVGAQGLQGTNGTNGSNGVNGQTVTPEELADSISQYLLDNPVVSQPGPPGIQGNAGQDGRTLQIQVDQVTCQLESKYDDSDSWSVIAQLPQPCEANDESSQ